VFDAIYGSSAGAINGAYLLANQADIGTTIYYDNINNNNFIDLKNIFRSKPIVNLNFLFHIMREVKPLNCKAILASPIPLNIVVSSIGKMGSVVLNNFKDSDDLMTSLKCSANMPVVAGGPISHKGDLFLDASVFQSIPLKAAMNDKCTHILALLTRPEGSPENKLSRFENIFVKHKLNKLKENLGNIYVERYNDYTKTLNFICDKIKDTETTPYILPIRLPNTYKKANNLEKNRDVLVNYSKGGARAVVDALFSKDYKVLETIRVFTPEGKKA
jgi:predicted patatin/cPLA2 family phospholipase